MKKAALVGEIQEAETSEDGESASSRRQCVAFCCMLTIWVSTPLLAYEAYGHATSLEREGRSQSLI